MVSITTLDMETVNIVKKRASPRPFVCDWESCDKSFNRKSDLQRHYRIHTKERPFFCTVVGCGKSFIQRSALTVHVRTHTGEKPHMCEHLGCDKKFSDSSSLARHRRIHTGNRPYKCVHSGCSKVFCRKTTMVKHQRRSHERGNQVRNDFDISDTDSDADDDLDLNGEPLQYPDLLQPPRMVPSQRSMLQSQPMSTSISQMPIYHPAGPPENNHLVRSQSYTNAETLASQLAFMSGNVNLAQRPLFYGGVHAPQISLPLRGHIHHPTPNHQAHHIVGEPMLEIPFNAAMQSSLLPSVQTSPVDLYSGEDTFYPNMSFSSTDFSDPSHSSQHESFTSFDYDLVDAPELTDEPSRPSTPLPLLDTDEFENVSPVHTSPMEAPSLYDLYQAKLEMETAGMMLPTARWAQQ